MPQLAQPSEHFAVRMALALLSRRDFREASQVSRSFSRWETYQDFLDERDALSLGYASAGVATEWQAVSWDAFVRWSRLTGAPLDIDGLDEFAAHVRWRQTDGDAPARGRIVGEGARTLQSLASGARPIPIRLAVFEAWQAAFARLALLPVPTLDDYAAQIAECCLAGSSAAPRPAVNSA